MRKLIVVLVLLIGIIVLQQKRYSAIFNLNKKLNDSLIILKIHKDSQISYSPYNKLLDSILKTYYYNYDNNVEEYHRITIQLRKDLLIFDVKSRADSTYHISYLHLSSEALDNNNLDNSIIKKQEQIIDKFVWIDFKNRLDSLNIYNTTRFNGSFVSNNLIWEASINGKRYRYESIYLFSRFSLAIEFLLSHVTNRDFILSSDFPSFDIVD